MPDSSVQWQPALVVLASGVVIGACIVWWVRRRAAAAGSPAPAGTPLELRDLDGRVAALVVQLRELEDAAVKRTPEQLARERYALELEAARAMRARDALAARVASPAAQPVAPPPAAGAARGFLWGAATSAAVAVLSFLVFQAAERRPEGSSVTGSVGGGQARGGMGGTRGGAAGEEPKAAVPPDARTLELRASLAKSPDDHDTRLELARHLLVERDLMGVWNETQYVLERQPGHPRALTYQSLVRLAMGQGDVAIAMLKRAIAAEPDLVEAHENLAFVYTSLGRTKEAAAEVAETARRSPADGERLRQALAQLAESRQTRPATEAHADVPPPPATTEAGPVASPSAAGGAVFGWIDADAAVVSRIRPGSVIFLTVRPAGVSAGPPAAVKRLVSGSFPLQFEVGAGDSMMGAGQPLPERVRIDVRADSDGDPLTRPPSDPAGYVDGVTLGKTGVRIALK